MNGSPRPDAEPTWANALKQVLPAFVVSRLLIVAVGVCALSWWTIEPDAAVNYQPYTSSWKAVEMWLHFDASWYLGIATLGYTGAIPAGFVDMRPAFFPAFPTFVAAVIPLVGSPIAAGLLVANLMCLAFLLCTWKLAAEDLGTRVATRATWILALFPSSFYLSGIYTESTMLAAMAGCLVATRRRVWWAVALTAGVATVSRTIGLLIVLPAAWDIWRSAQPLRARVQGVLVVGGTVTAALAGYLWYAARTFGDPLRFVEVQGWYRGTTTWPWRALDPWLELPAWHGYANSTMDVALVVLALWLCVEVGRRWNLGYAVYALAAVLIPLTSGLISFSRLMLAAFPCFVGLALVTERRGARIAWFAVSVLLLAVLVGRYATWRWVA